jgi:D-amino-acid dehydrogenase
VTRRFRSEVGFVPETRYDPQPPREPVVHVVIVGAGAIGMASALDLARRGVKVTVIDRGPVGGGCSYGNAGWLTPCFATPLPAPGVLSTSLGWLLDPDSPLYIEPSLDPAWFRWMARFILSARRAPFERGTKALLALSRFSLDAYAALDRELPGAFGFQQKGLLAVGQTREKLEGFSHEARAMAQRGVMIRILDPDQVRELEPAVRGPVAGGIYYPEEAHCEPLAAVETMAQAARKHGAVVETGVELIDFRATGTTIEALRTTRGWIEADRVVLATGSWTKALAVKIGLRVPVLGGKGYAVIVKSVDPAPRMPIKVIDRRIAITPRADSVRLAGTLQLVDGDESITSRRVDAIVNGSKTILNITEPPEIVEVWRGLRPCTPDGLPVIGVAPRHDNLVVATGHQMCGLHTAPGTGRLVADLITGEKPTFDPAPFRADRF